MLQTAQSPQIASSAVMTPRPITVEANQTVLEFALRVQRLFARATQR